MKSSALGQPRGSESVSNTFQRNKSVQACLVGKMGIQLAKPFHTTRGLEQGSKSGLGKLGLRMSA